MVVGLFGVAWPSRHQWRTRAEEALRLARLIRRHMGDRRPAEPGQRRGLELVPSDLVADGGKKAPGATEGWAARAAAQCRPGRASKWAQPDSDGRRICYRPRSQRQGVVPFWYLVLRNLAGAVANGVELEAVLEGPLCCRTAALVATVPWPDTSVQAEGVKGLWTAKAGGVSAGEQRSIDWNLQRP
ncbi:hypothetical protein NDU88_000052 [Pleurodeles waltl]|uniref:Uncharacterized protein n=1 Tax=Pleurodeles waltl TaxID=8319 RepID=A0AAV7U6D4_PLEWA|nr:hypothetical protein NDU88_000052 [Pleurodeles waltl]